MADPMINVNWYEEVSQRKEQMLNHLKSFLTIESVLDESGAEEGAPFGKKVAEALQFMLDLGEKDGFTTKNVDGFAAHIEHGQGEELIGVLSHVDVVPAGDGWTTPAFAPEIRDGKIYARGAIDDKGPTMAAYYALKIVKELDLPLFKRVRLILGGDEESLWRCMDHYFKQEEMPQMGFTPDADFPIIHAEKGLLDLKIIGKPHSTPDIQYSEDVTRWTLLSFEAGHRPNMVPDLAVVKLAGDGDVFELKETVQEFLLSHQIQGYASEADDHVSLVFKGRSHHGAEPEKGLNAALECARFLAQLPLDQEGATFIKMMNDRLVDSFFGEKLGVEQHDDVVGRLTVNAGVFHYKKDEQQLICLNVRYPISGHFESIVDKINQELMSYGLQVEDVVHKAPHFCDPHHSLVTTLAGVYEEQTGERAELLAIGGGTYARALEIGVAFGPLFPGKAETAHQKDEHVDVEDLLRATALYAQAIYELAQK